MPKDSTSLVANKSLQHAKQYLRLGNYGRAFAHYLVVLRLSSAHSNDEIVQEDFVFALGQWGQELEKQKKIKELFECYEQALEFFSANDILLCNFGAHLFRLGYLEEAAVYFRRAVLQAPNSVTARAYLDNSASALVERWHFGMLNCVKRNQAFKDAIERAVSKGHDTVLDIGAGTGLLSMFAVHSGAKDVFACEMSPTMYQVATETLETNKMNEKVQLLQMKSTDMKVPEHIPNRVLLVVTETFDSCLFGEHILETVIHAWDHLLNPSMKLHVCHESASAVTAGGCVIPSSATLWACLIECSKIRQYSRLTVDQAEFFGMPCSSLIMMQNEEDLYTTERLSEIRGGYKKLCQPVKILDVNFNDAEMLQKLADGQSFTYNVCCSDGGRLDAIAVWFDLQLDEIISISSGPESGTCWEQAVYPTIDPYSDEILVDLNSQVSIHVHYQRCLKVTHSFVTPVNRSSGIKADSKTLRMSAAVTSSQLLVLNDRVYQSALHAALAQHSNTANILLSCTHPLGAAIVALKLGATRVGCLQMKNSEYELILHQAKGQNLAMEQLTFETEESLLKEGPIWNVLAIDVIETSGIIRPETIAEISILRECALKQPVTIIPRKVNCLALLIQSDALLERNRVIDDKTLGYIVSRSINVFKVAHHQDLDLWTLPHTKLTDPLTVLTFDFTSDDRTSIGSPHNNRCAPFSYVKCQQSTTLTTTNCGSVSAVAFWFEMHLTNNIVISSLDIDSHWNQAAFVLDEPLIVRTGHSLTLLTSFDNGHISFALQE